MTRTAFDILMTVQDPPAWLFVLFPVVFVGMWTFVCFVISRFGWHGFALTHRCRYPPSGSSHGVSLVRFGPFTRYSNVVRGIPCDSGIYFHNIFLFRPFHPPFLIPWTSVTGIRKASGFLVSGYEVRVEDPAGVLIARFRDSAGPALRQLAPHLITDH